MEIKEEEEVSFSLGGQPFICLTSGHLWGTYCLLGHSFSCGGRVCVCVKSPVWLCSLLPRLALSACNSCSSVRV